MLEQLGTQQSTISCRIHVMSACRFCYVFNLTTSQQELAQQKKSSKLHPQFSPKVFAGHFARFVADLVDKENVREAKNVGYVIAFWLPTIIE